MLVILSLTFSDISSAFINAEFYLPLCYLYIVDWLPVDYIFGLLYLTNLHNC